MSLLRGRRLHPQISEAASYTSSIRHDVEIVEEVVKVNMAHVVMLTERNLIDRYSAALILKALSSLDTSQPMDESLEDVHMNLERYIVEKVGVDVGGRMHLAKSRNDQVAAALRMKLRSKIIEAGLAMTNMRKVLLKQCEAHLKTIMPGYTHLQRAQPTTLAHHLLAYHDALARDTQRLKELYSRVNLSPMGAVAMAATTFPIDRRRVASLLGFEGFIENTIDAVSSRDFLLEALALASLAINTLSRLAEELVLWSTQEFNFVELPDEYSSTSSIMPQKKNPTVAEVARARASKIYGHLSSALSMLNTLPLSYNLDMQEATPHLWEAFNILISTLKVMSNMVSSTRFKIDRMAQALSDGFTNATELANLLVKKGLSFREAHYVVGFLTSEVLKTERTLLSIKVNELTEAVQNLLNKSISLSEEEVKQVLDSRWIVEACPVEGGPSSVEVGRMVLNRLKLVEDDEEAFMKLKKKLAEADENLLSAIRSIELSLEGS